MSKILAISDVHIHDYPQRNPSEKYRLLQARTVAANIIQAAKNEGAEILVLAGDILEKSVVRPYVLAEVKLFLDTLMAHFKVGYIVWGNHDQDNKGADQDFTDSCLSVMLPANLYYADSREITIDNTRIAFSNWRPEFDLGWIRGKVDVLFTHATISYSGSDLFKSQELDESKFDLAICGDIHKPGTIGKYVSIGIPQRCKMSDGSDITGVVFDCVTKQWKWVPLDPGNLMKFEYTTDRDLEGWNPGTGIWSVYKPENLGIHDGVRDIQVPAWKEIEHLIDNIITSNGLGGIHGEVLKNMKDIESKEVDFNFILTRFYCKNWRSIDEVELYFEDADKILITGDNGSGKSSLLSALRYALEDNRFLKDFIQFGSKECVAEVDFLYQGNLYRLQRGSKKYGLWINGEPQKYNNKKEFEEDARTRFPFIDYMDIYFFDSDHHKLIGDISPERKSEIVSKFFKMDKIDAYNEEAEVLLGQMGKNTSRWKEEMERSKKLLEYIDQKLSVIQVPGIPREILEQDKQTGLEMQKKAKIRSDWEIASAQLNGKIENYQETIKRLERDIRNSRAEDIIDSEIALRKELITDISTNKIPGLSGITSEYNEKITRLGEINREGSKLYAEFLDLGKTKTCPTCGQALKSGGDLDKHKAELETKLRELGAKKDALTVEIAEIQERKKDTDRLMTEYRGRMQILNNEITSLMSEKRALYDSRKAVSDNKIALAECHRVLNAMGIPEQVILPDHFMETMAKLDAGINAWMTYEDLGRDKEKAEASIYYCQSELDRIALEVQELQRYIKITGPTGKIYEEIMTKLAEQFSDNQVKYEVVTYNFRKKDHLDLASYFYNNGNWVGYQACSSGQKTVLDVNFLSKIVTRMGLLVMDEFLKHLDPGNHDICIDLIKSTNIGCTMISSHAESIASFNNKSCRLELNASGITKISLK